MYAILAIECRITFPLCHLALPLWCPAHKLNSMCRCSNYAKHRCNTCSSTRPCMLAPARYDDICMRTRPTLSPPHTHTHTRSHSHPHEHKATITVLRCLTILISYLYMLSALCYRLSRVRIGSALPAHTGTLQPHRTAHAHTHTSPWWPSYCLHAPTTTNSKLSNTRNCFHYT